MAGFLSSPVWPANDKNEANEVETKILVIIILTEHQFFTIKSTVLHLLLIVPEICLANSRRRLRILVGLDSG